MGVISPTYVNFCSFEFDLEIHLFIGSDLWYFYDRRII